MKQIASLLALSATAIIVVLIVLNWSTLIADAPLNLILAQVQAPLGVVMLGMAAVIVALFFVAYLKSQIGSLLETRRLLNEIQRVQDIADKAEASRSENLHQLVATEFRLLNERLNSIADAKPLSNPAHNYDQEGRPLSLTEIMTHHERS